MKHESHMIDTPFGRKKVHISEHEARLRQKKKEYTPAKLPFAEKVFDRMEKPEGTR